MSAQPVEEVRGSDPVDHLEPGEGPGDDALREPPQLEVRRNAVASALLGAASSAVAIAYLWRAAEMGQVLDWVLCGALGMLAAMFLHSLLDARTPLLVADEMGIRIRLGTTWRGLPWEAIERVVVRPRRGWLRDGSVVVQLVHVARSIEGLEGRARRHALVNRKLYGAALAVPLGVGVRTDASDAELSDRIASLSQGRAEVVTLIDLPQTEADPEGEPTPGSPSEELAEPEEALAAEVASDPSGDDAPTADEGAPRARRWWSRRQTEEPGDQGDDADELDVEEPDVAADDGDDPDDDPDTGESLFPAAVVSEPSLPDQRSARAVPLRTHDERVTITLDDAGHRSTRTSDAVNSVREAFNPVGRSDSRVRAIAKLGDPVAPLVIDNYQPDPAYDPVIGPELAASRTRVGLSVDELAERTRIRPHVIESMEVDDFTPCGGDFYARGHIRTLSRVLGKDPVPLLEQYEARYAHAPVNARKVFEAELATGMGGQMTRPYGGPNWTGLVAAVLVLVLVWAAVRLFAGGGGEVFEEPPPVLDGSAGLSSSYGDLEAAVKPVAATLTAGQTGAEVEVRDADGNLVHEGEIVAGQVLRLRVPPPVTVTSDDGGAVQVRIGEVDKGLLGEPGEPATRTYASRG